MAIGGTSSVLLSAVLRLLTRSGAFELARDQAKREQARVVIHRPNGVIRNSNSYGNDPNPPKDKVR